MFGFLSDLYLLSLQHIFSFLVLFDFVSCVFYFRHWL